MAARRSQKTTKTLLFVAVSLAAILCAFFIVSSSAVKIKSDPSHEPKWSEENGYISGTTAAQRGQKGKSWDEVAKEQFDAREERLQNTPAGKAFLKWRKTGDDSGAPPVFQRIKNKLMKDYQKRLAKFKDEKKAKEMKTAMEAKGDYSLSRPEEGSKGVVKHGLARYLDKIRGKK